MEKNDCYLPQNWKEPKIILIFTIVIVLGVVLVVSILRDRIVNNIQNQVTVTGRGEVTYQPDVASVNLGVQIDKAETAEMALSKMNEKMNSIIQALEKLGISREDIITQNYSLYPQRDYISGSSSVAGYNANQQIVVKLKDIDENPDNLNQVIAEASKAGTNQVLGINFEVSSVNDLKQKARVAAIQDARSKADELAQAAGIKRLGKVVSWYENYVDDVQNQVGLYKGGLGAGEASSISPDVPAGNQKIVIEIGVIYQVK